MKKNTRTLLILFFSALLILSVVNVINILGNYRVGKDSYQSLEQFVAITEPAAATEPEESPLEESAPSLPEDTAPIQEEAAKLPVDFDQLAQINPDIVGWIYIPGTNINYPVVQGTDNDYYLNHLFDGTVNAAGCIFLDAGNASDLTDAHSVIYGHHMKDDSMFATLANYKKSGYHQEHPTGTLVTRDGIFTIRFFSGYVCDDWSDAWQLDFAEGELEVWLENIAGRSCFPCQDLPDDQDTIVTLSTCTYEFENAKFVLHGYIENTPDSAQ